MDKNAALVYLNSTNSSSYSRFYELKSDYNSNAWPRLMNAIYVLNNTSSHLIRERVDGMLAVDRWPISPNGRIHRSLYLLVDA